MQTHFSQDWMKTTTLNPLGLALLVVLGIAVFFLPRRFAVIPLLVMGCFVSQAQNVVFLGLSFYLLRTLALLALVRCIAKGEVQGFRWNAVDSAVLAWSIISSAIFTIQMGPSGLVTKFGWFCDGALVYYVARCLIRTVGDVKVVATTLVILSVPVVIAFLIEYGTARNMFAVFGGVPAITAIREGRLRCQGAFAHPILAGCFWASALSSVASLWWQTASRRWFAIMGVVCGIVIIVLCASSTPILGVVAGVTGGLCLLLRRYLRLIRWGVVGLLVSLHLMMKAPVWSLVQRVDIIGGSTGNFRYRLIDGAINHFREWWLIGTPDTAHWGWGLQDVTNQYILEGVRGGFVSLLLFLLIFALAFRHIGRLCNASSSNADTALYWGLGVALFVHCVNFMGVAYFGQIVMLLNLQLAMIASLTVTRRDTTQVTRPIARSGLRKRRVLVQPAVTDDRFVGAGAVGARTY